MESNVVGASGVVGQVGESGRTPARPLADGLPDHMRKGRRGYHSGIDSRGVSHAGTVESITDILSGGWDGARGAHA